MRAVKILVALSLAAILAVVAVIMTLAAKEYVGRTRQMEYEVAHADDRAQKIAVMEKERADALERQRHTLLAEAARSKIPIEESDIMFLSRFTLDQVHSAALLVVRFGHPCSSVTTMRKRIYGDGYHISCNAGRDRYDVVDKGDRMVVYVE